ncbi:ankyrin [Neurospora tetrasperma FGSC 2509]|nr:ankyrin [Neurospora tetrasperma FGSC 2509]
MRAVESGNLVVAKFLIEQGADTNLRDGEGELALHKIWYTTEVEDTAVSLARMLVVNCVHLEAQNKSGKTPLHVAAARGLRKLVRLLVESGADTEATDYHGKGPLFLAATSLRPQTVEMLLKFGAKVEGTEKGPSALEKVTKFIGRYTREANRILSEYENLKQRTSHFEPGPMGWSQITDDTLNMTHMINGWSSELAKRSLATYRVLRRAVADTGIGMLDEHEIEALLHRAMKDMDQLREDAKPMMEANLRHQFGGRP